MAHYNGFFAQCPDLLVKFRALGELYELLGLAFYVFHGNSECHIVSAVGGDSTRVDPQCSSQYGGHTALS